MDEDERMGVKNHFRNRIVGLGDQSNIKHEGERVICDEI